MNTASMESRGEGWFACLALTLIKVITRLLLESLFAGAGQVHCSQSTMQLAARELPRDLQFATRGPIVIKVRRLN